MRQFCCFMFLINFTRNICQHFFTCHLFFRSNNAEGYNTTVAAYHEFLSRASEWLSHKATDVCICLLCLEFLLRFMTLSVFLILECLFRDQSVYLLLELLL